MGDGKTTTTKKVIGEQRVGRGKGRKGWAWGGEREGELREKCILISSQVFLCSNIYIYIKKKKTCKHIYIYFAIPKFEVRISVTHINEAQCI